LNEIDKKVHLKKNFERLSELIITLDELKKYDGSDGSPGLYLGLLGEVFDVSSGKSNQALPTSVQSTKFRSVVYVFPQRLL
jgi:hypothetical protein